MKFWIFAIYTFIFGAAIGSFLNVCIYRMPRGILLWAPRRSFCFHCHNHLKWKEIIPIFSWLALRGRCSHCHTVIPFRYPLVELLTGTFFVISWITFDFPQNVAFCLLGSLLITATFLDLETLTIPNPITLGGLFAGVTLGLVHPASLGEPSVKSALLKATTGAVTGYTFLWAVLETGKRCFGRTRFRWNFPQKFSFLQQGGNTSFECAGEIWKGEDMFVRKSDELIIEATCWQMANGTEGHGTLRLKNNRLRTAQGELRLREGQQIAGQAIAISIPREAMGWGDVKLLAAIGAFIGAPGVLFTIFCASLLGALVGIFLLFCRGNKPIPFGPFLAMGAFAWIFGGQTLWNLYFSYLTI